MKKVFKFMLLWITFISVILLIMTVDSISFIGWMLWLFLNMALIWACFKTLSYEELYKYSGSASIDRLFKTDI